MKPKVKLHTEWSEFVEIQAQRWQCVLFSDL